jgi:hypothetical protein
VTISAVHAGWGRLHHSHALVLDTATMEIRMANPFSAVSTAHRVLAAGRWWHADCAWDAFGVCAALQGRRGIETSCPDCDGAITVEVLGGRSDERGLWLFHCLVPPPGGGTTSSSPEAP